MVVFLKVSLTIGSSYKKMDVFQSNQSSEKLQQRDAVQIQARMLRPWHIDLLLENCSALCSPVGFPILYTKVLVALIQSNWFLTIGWYTFVAGDISYISAMNTLAGDLVPLSRICSSRPTLSIESVFSYQSSQSKKKNLKIR